ncbi:hypothetical protein GCK72_026008 [Caenorhabditis remanei]|uniref:Uncharacterized protein n=1 Tax=Caenorhabditis remanei TaxID=31234 RepID=E3NEX7_CAERE|nr:hypothetical protein GCK72_026008 [Caenorhabditis remanei]EFO95844.1 hypothetical protein CRE_14302 [Caenorhabditis remanei]KAF1749540.1 hypothetical protein GCK72_026008 [Caenorhabditis remanei]
MHSNGKTGAKSLEENLHRNSDTRKRKSSVSNQFPSKKAAKSYPANQDKSAESDNDSAMSSKSDVAAPEAGTHEAPEALEAERSPSSESNDSDDNDVVESPASRRLLGRPPSSDKVGSDNEPPKRHEEEEKEVVPLPDSELLREFFENIPEGDDDDPGTPSSYHSSEISSTPTTPERPQAPPAIEVDGAVYRQPERDDVGADSGGTKRRDEESDNNSEKSPGSSQSPPPRHEEDEKGAEEEEEVVPVPDMEFLREFFKNIPEGDNDDPGTPSSYHSSEVSSTPTTPERRQSPPAIKVDGALHRQPERDDNGPDSE